MECDALRDYLVDFLGYGDPNPGGVWFVGPEERGECLEKRVWAWKESRIGPSHLADVRKFHELLPDCERFFSRGDFQATWAGIIRMLLGPPCDSATRKKFQMDRLGRQGMGHALLELSPVPRHQLSRDGWRESSLEVKKCVDPEGIPVLKRRRLAAFKRAFEDGKPRAIVFYGRSAAEGHAELSRELTGVAVQFAPDGSPWCEQAAGCTLITVRHPTQGCKRCYVEGVHSFLNGSLH